MSKKDYILLAKSINKAFISLSYASVNMGETKRAVETVAEILASELKTDNARFDTDKFLLACNIK